MRRFLVVHPLTLMRFYLSILKFTLLPVCLLPCFAASDTLYFMDAGLLQGEAGDFEDGLFSFQTAWSEAPVPVRSDHIGNIVFAEPEPYSVHGQYEVLLKNGDRFYGEVLRESDEAVTLRTFWIPEMTLPRKHVQSLRERPPGQRSILTVPIERHTAARSRMEEGPEANALQEMDALYLANPWDLSVPLPKVPERAWFSADLSLDEVLTSRLHAVETILFASRATPSGRGDGLWVGVRGDRPGDRVTLRWRARPNAILSQFRDLETDMLDNGRILLQVETDLRENEMRVFVNGKPHPPFQLKDYEVEADGETKYLVLTVRHPAVRVHAFEFGEGPLPDPGFFSRIATHSGEVPIAAPEGSVRVRLTGGNERLTLLPVRLTGEALQARHPLFDEAVRLPRENISVLQFNAHTQDRKDRSPRLLPPVRIFPSSPHQAE